MAIFGKPMRHWLHKYAVEVITVLIGCFLSLRLPTFAFILLTHDTQLTMLETELAGAVFECGPSRVDTSEVRLTIFESSMQGSSCSEVASEPYSEVITEQPGTIQGPINCEGLGLHEGICFRKDANTNMCYVNGEEKKLFNILTSRDWVYAFLIGADETQLFRWMQCDDE